MPKKTVYPKGPKAGVKILELGDEVSAGSFQYHPDTKTLNVSYLAGPQDHRTESISMHGCKGFKVTIEAL